MMIDDARCDGGDPGKPTITYEVRVMNRPNLKLADASCRQKESIVLYSTRNAMLHRDIWRTYSASPI